MDGSRASEVLVGAGPIRLELRDVSQRRIAGLFKVHLYREGTEELILAFRPLDNLSSKLTALGFYRLVVACAELESSRRNKEERESLCPFDEDSDPHFGIVTSPAMVELLATARKIAKTEIPVLITGETGTGKELLARAIHHHSARAEHPFLPFTCTAVPREMLDSQLFGYRRGAFTGAQDAFAGVIRGASGGTLFLDEIGEIGLDVQPKLLRFLETGDIHPLGESKPVKADVRIIAATNANLEQLVSEGRFREDLYYRLNVIRFRLPPLRERREEIPPLAHHFLRTFGDELRKGRLRISDETLEYLLLYNWPGNVRQLSNEIRRLAALAEPDATLMPEHLSADIRASRRTIPATGLEPGPDEMIVQLDQPLDRVVEAVERAMVRRALDACGGHFEEAAALLGITRKGLYLKRRRLGLDPPGPTAPPAGAPGQTPIEDVHEREEIDGRGLAIG